MTPSKVGASATPWYRGNEGRATLLAACAGILGVGAFAPFSAFWLAWPAWGILFLLVSRAPSPRRAAARGFAFGLAHFLGGVSWIYVSLHDVGGMPLPVAAAATLALCAYMALYPALAAWGARYLDRAGMASWRSACLLAASWVLSEWGRGWVLTGFPWLALGYSQSPPSPLAGWAPLLGVYGVSLCTTLLAAFGALAVVTRKLLPAAIALALLGLGAGLAQVAWTMPVGAPLKVALLQGNIPQALKWQPERFLDSLSTYVALARDNPADLTVLPETAVPALYDQLPPEFLADLKALAARRRGDILLGVPVADESGGERRYFNSAIGFGAAPEQSYSKSHLVPFGEFVPPGFRWFLDLMHMPMSDFSSGGSAQPTLALAGQQVAPNICYEDVFGGEIIHALPRATLLINLSNTAWFGHSLAQPQHLQIAQLRSLETGRPMLRATNTGMTAVVMPDGRVQAVLPPFTRGALVAEVRGYTGLTPFARTGNTVALFLASLLLAAGALARRRETQ
ncbi:MAG TPA: apolipoprotein N-acyltransferase [Azospira sp.]|nr:apolipoprotein N-acyltransferase [Azospira sp.]